MTDDHRLPCPTTDRGSGPSGRVGTRRHARWVAGVACAVAAFGVPATARASALSAGAARTRVTVPALSAGASRTRVTLPHKLGLIPTRSPRVSPNAIAKVTAAAAALPASIDLTRYAMPAGNQGGVGSCAAWATDYTALGYWENRQGIAGGALQPMYTYSQVTGGVDQGSSIEGNLQVDEQGIDVQTDYWQGNFDFSDMPTTAERGQAVNWKLTGYSNLPVNPSGSATVTQQSIEAALAAGNPVVIGLPVYNNFFYVTGANSGFYAGPSGGFAGYHAVTALGYNASGLVIENSWGAGWGNSGFATLSWSFVNADVFDAVSVGPLRAGQPVGTTAPAVTGTGHQGQALTASTGSWSPTATSYTYQWQRAADSTNHWSTIAGATAATYTPAAADLGAHLRVSVTAANGTGQGASTSAQFGPITTGAPAVTAAPSITGALRVGQTLTAAAGSWSPVATSYKYQWQRSTNGGSTWSTITGATGPAYLTAAADANADERVVVTATNSYGSTTATSALAGPVSAVPNNTAAPTVTGSLVEGQTLTATSGSWNPAATSYAYQWQRSTNGGTTWVSISGMTHASYVLEPSDVGNQVRIQVMATNPSGSTYASATVGPIVSGALRNTVAPAITGTALRGSTLTVGTGTWTPAGAAYTLHWQHSSNGGVGWTTIANATGATYALGVSDENTELRVVVTAVNAYGTVTATSAATGPVKTSHPESSAAPALSGMVKVGHQLTATTGSWSGAGNRYTYQWQRESGTTWSAISGATSPTYTLAHADSGDHIRVLVTATNPDATASEASAATASVS
jgi:hypothetical protein